MNLSPFFSIIVPVYQSKLYLKNAVSSLLRQTFRNIEIILIDDGSTDGSAKICDEFAKQDDRIIVVHNQHRGVSFARNVGIKISSGKWIIFVDSDDLVSSIMCEDFFNHIVKRTDLDFVSCVITKDLKQLTTVASKNNIIFSTNNKAENIKLIKHILLKKYDNFPNGFRTYFADNIILNSPCAKAYKKDFILNSNLSFDSKVHYSEDLLFNVQLLAYNAKGIFVKDTVYYYRRNLSSVSNKTYVPHVLDNYIAFKESANRIFINNDIVSMKTILDTYCFREALLIMPADIFRPDYSLKQSLERFKEITKCEQFSKIFSWNIYSKSKETFDLQTKIKGKLLLKHNFLILTFIYRVKQF